MVIELILSWVLIIVLFNYLAESRVRVFYREYKQLDNNKRAKQKNQKSNFIRRYVQENPKLMTTLKPVDKQSYILLARFYSAFEILFSCLTIFFLFVSFSSAIQLHQIDGRANDLAIIMFFGSRVFYNLRKVAYRNYLCTPSTGNT